MIKKILKIVLGLILILVMFLFYYRGEEIFLETKIRINSWDDYHKEFYFENVSIDDDEKKIEIDFVYKDLRYDAYSDVIKKVYEDTFDIFFGDENNGYYNYEMEIYFGKLQGYQSFVLRNITNDKSDICIVSYIGDKASVGDICEICPEVSNLYLNELEYESLDEFDDFLELKEVHCSDSAMSDEEQEYILSLFPNCELDWKGKHI